MEVVSLEQPVAAPWAEITEFIPEGFSLGHDGVYLDKQNPVLISGPCWISAFTRSKDGRDWGIVVHWIDHDGRQQSAAFPKQFLIDRGVPLANELMARGLRIIPGKQSMLMQYLGMFELPAELRLQSVIQLGWLDCAEDESPVFVLPEKTFGLGMQDTVIFQPEEHSPTAATLHQRGTLEQWRSFVASKCEGHPFMVFGLCTAFGGPVLKLFGEDCGGFHFYGASSKGKTTTLQVAASVWGCGADPATSSNSLISRWNTTGNALEATASAHNDGLLCLDEMGTCDQRNFGKVIYDLMGGTGKRRLTKSAALQPTRSWRILVLSTGEISVKQKIEEEGALAAKTGQLIRLVDIPIEDGVLNDLDTVSAQALISDLKRNAGRYYGTAGPAFIDAVIRQGGDLREIKQRVQDLAESIENSILRLGTLETHQRRVLRRMAMVGAAGILAVRAGILPFREEEILASVQYVAKCWLGEASNLPTSTLGMLQLRDFIAANESRFRPAGDSDKTVRDVVGYITHAADNGRRLFLMTRAGLAEACKGYDLRLVLRELKRRGYLYLQEVSKMTSKHTIDGAGRQSLYGIRESFMDFDG